MSLANNIKKIRESKNISVDIMAKRLGIFNLVYISIEKGIKKPSNELLKKIASIFEISISEIINYDSVKIETEKRSLDLKNLKDSTKVFTEDSNKNSIPKTITISNVTFVPVNPPTIKETISKKPMLLDRKDIFSFTNNINIVGVKNILPQTTISNINPLSGLIDNKDKTSSPRILNYIEPFMWKGKFKTMFFTEVNTGLKVGDRVFIVNGNYDSDSLIKINKYKRGRDGYKVIFVDNCKIALDIEYSGTNPFNQDSIDNFINIYYIKNQSDFIYFNRQLSTKGVFSAQTSVPVKFDLDNDNIVYSDGYYPVISSGWGKSLVVVGNQTAISDGFYLNNKDIWSQTFIDFPSSSNNNLPFIIKPTNNGRLKINNGTFTYSSIKSKILELKEDCIYKWDIDLEEWVVDITYQQPFISKSNFRDGNFRGEWNSGIYGRSDKRINWTGNPAKWNLGTLLNTRWLDGTMNSIYTLPVSFNTEFENNIPYQKLNAPNNNGNGFNYVVDSELNKILIKNGNIYNTTINGGSTQSVIESHVMSLTFSSLSKAEGGLFNNSKFVNTETTGTKLSNCRSLNSKFNNITSINSGYKNCLIKDSTYLSSNNIKILDYEELFFTISPTKSSTHKIFRFYISESDADKLKIRDRFYIKGLRILDGSSYPLNFFDRRFRLSTWTEYIEVYQSDQFFKMGFEIGAFLSTAADNKFLYSAYRVGSNFINTTISANNKKLFSIDIVISMENTNSSTLLLNNNIIKSEVPNSTLQGSIFTLNNNFSFATSPQPAKLSDKIRDIVDISNAFIVNSDFESGIMETSDWISGDHINYNNDVNITSNNSLGGTYSITTSGNQLILKTTAQTDYLESGDDCLLKDNIVFLNVEYDFSGITKLPDTYKIINNNFRQSGQLVLEEVGTSSVIQGLTPGGTFKVDGAENRYGYVYKAKIDKTKIKSGIFRRSYITNSFIENENYNVNDKNFSNIPLIKSLLLSDMIFKNTGNILSKATYISSSFVNGSDAFNDGIVFKSIWNGMTFSNGVVRESNWINGVFESGTFYENRSFNASPNVIYQYYDVNRKNSYYKSGTTATNISNDRYSWKDGIFNGGEFYKSDWENGQLKGGKFYSSKFYNGIISGGSIGDKNLPSTSTNIYNGTINSTTVENALLYASDTSLGGASNSTITWNDGIFNGGLFGTNNTQMASNMAVWNNGEFNGGEFASMAKWKNGIFNGGKFTSTLGWTLSNSATQSDYTWEDGVFNEGVFGIANTATNSTWYTGEFNGGKFIGRVWNNGIFSYGLFEGSATVSAIGGVSSSNSNTFVNSFTQSYYGLWRNGVVSDKKDRFITNKKFFTEPKIFNYREPDKSAIMSNVLWTDGIFSHEKAEVFNSVWLNGKFEKGFFVNSAFNPYVIRGIGSSQPSFELSDSCYWQNGNLVNSDFYISKWEYGNFNIGDAYGMIWKDGVCEYMNAFNIFWEKGLWRNGNWYGSYFSYNGSVNDDFTKQIIYRGMSWSGTQSCHIWNIFEDSKLETQIVGSGSAASLQFDSVPISSIGELAPPPVVGGDNGGIGGDIGMNG